MTRDYTMPVLPGTGESDYARYMRTDTLLALQRDPADVVHRDELLFQTVHQSTELWLKLAVSDVAEAVRIVEREGLSATAELDDAICLLTRGAQCLRMITDQLDIMRFLSPWDFQLIRTVLGNGSGFESPGWNGVREVCRSLEAALTSAVRGGEIDLVEVYKTGRPTALYRLCEAVIEWDERISIWRVEHYKMATRIIGHQVIGTKGTPVDTLAKLISHKFFPDLWRVRTVLTETGPMSTDWVAGS